jgi:hypothetical protein
MEYTATQALLMSALAAAPWRCFSDVYNGNGERTMSLTERPGEDLGRP